MFIQGGSILLMHCGRIISHIVWRGVNDSDSAASHCVEGIERTAPRTTSATFAMTGSAKPMVAFCQSGKGMVVLKMVTWNGTRNMTKNKSTSHGALRKTWVTNQLTPATILISESNARPSQRPAMVPSSIASSEMAMLKANPVSRRGAHFTITSSGDSTVGPPALQADDATMTLPKQRIAADRGLIWKAIRVGVTR